MPQGQHNSPVKSAANCKRDSAEPDASGDIRDYDLRFVTHEAAGS
jgi:hypothetical protein